MNKEKAQISILDNILSFRNKKAMTIKQICEETVFSMPFPYGVIEETGALVFANGPFMELFNIDEDEINLFDKLPNLQSSTSNSILGIGDKMYNVFTAPLPLRDKKDYYMVFFIELTDAINSISKKPLQNCIVALIFIDNYDEVIEGMRDENKPLLMAVIERKLGELARKLHGVLKKFERDKFVFVFAEDKLEYLIENKFSILNQIKEVSLGNTIPVTISMGVGINSESLYESMESARAAIDLALGRGGDQALIKNHDDYQFFGGNKQETAKSIRVKARVKAYALEELISASSKVFVMGHVNPDLDSIGSALGVYRIAKFLSKTCKIVMKVPSSGILNLYNRLMEIEEYQDLFITEEEALYSINETSLLIVVDTHRPSILESQALLDAAKKVIVFDHHKRSTEFIQNTVLLYHDPFASSTSELIAEVIQYIRGMINLTNCEADAMLAGITVDTKNYMVNTGMRTFEAAAFLRRKGADSERVRMLFRSEMIDYKAKAAAIKDAEIYYDRMAIAICPTYGNSPLIPAAQAADELLNISGIDASFVLCEYDNKVYISARSINEINVYKIMEKMGGGGHQTVAGVQLSDITMEEALIDIKKSISEYLEEEKL